jgi:FAD dependent oxidoreductase TIGR03364
LTPRAVVVGAGVIGSLHAYLTLERGFEVVHVERELTARGASVRNFGLIWVSGRKPGDELELALRSRALWQSLASEVRGTGFRANGSLTVAQHPAELQVFEQVLAAPDAAARGFELLEPAEARALNPSLRGDLLGALLCRSDAAVEPRFVPEALREHMERIPGYRFLPGRHVTEVDDAGVRDHTGDRHDGDVVFVCPGAHTGVAGWQPSSLRRVRLQMLETEPFAEPVTTSIADGDSLRYYPAFDVPARAGLPEPTPVVRDRHVQLLLQQRLDGGLTIGDTHDYDEPFAVDLDEAPYRHLLERAESILGTTLPPVRRRWAGVYSQATNGDLFQRQQVGERAWVVTGAGGRGMTLAPAIAERVLDELGL